MSLRLRSSLIVPSRYSSTLVTRASRVAPLVAVTMFGCARATPPVTSAGAPSLAPAMEVASVAAGTAPASPGRAAGSTIVAPAAGAAGAGAAAASDAAAPRERPAILPCPWVNAPQANTRNEVVAPPPAGVIDAPRPRIPDCVKPGWSPPTEYKAFTPPTLPADRPKPIVDDYLKYIVTAPPPEIVARFKLDTTYYQKYADANGYPILASGKVADAAVAIVRDQVTYMLGQRPDLRDTMVARGGRIVIMAETEHTVDLPEQRGWTVPKYLDPRLTEQERARYYEPGGLGSMSPAGYWNPRARGMGGTLTSCAEENVLGYYRTRYWGTNICVHEFSHAIMGAGIGNADPKWFQAIVDSYKTAKVACRRTAIGYSGNTFNEYWAGGVEWYVGNGGRDRAGLKAEDPTLYELVSRLIPENKSVPVRANVANRTREEMERYVREHNAEWWEREQGRQAEAAIAARADSVRRAAVPQTATAAPAAATPPCVPAPVSPSRSGGR